MNKSNAGSVNNYLTNASLFKSSQKNRFVSAFVTHKNYFERDQAASSIPPTNMTKSKKLNPFTMGDSVQLGPIEEDNADALKATIKKEEGLPAESPTLMQGGAVPAEQKNIKQKEPLAAHSSHSVIDQLLKRESARMDAKTNTKIVVNYSKNASEKEKSMKGENVIDLVEQTQPRRNSRHSSYLNIKESVPAEQEANPYLPSSAKKEQQDIYRTDNGQAGLKKIDSHSLHPASSILAQSPREQLFLTTSSIDRKRESEPQRVDHLSSIKKEMGGYLGSIKERLNGSYICLETIEYEFDVLIDKTLQLECEKLRNVLYRLIEEEVSDFREFERRQFSKQKFLFMSDLFEIKCNIDLRLEELEQCELKLRSEHQWKSSVAMVVGLDYNENINFILRKADEIQKDLLSRISADLGDYVKNVNEEVTRNMRKGIRDNFETVYEGFKELRARGKLFSYKDHPE